MTKKRSILLKAYIVAVTLVTLIIPLQFLPTQAEEGEVLSATVRPGIWSSKAEIALLSTDNPAWNGVSSWADKPIGSTLDLSDQNSDDDVIMLANAIAYAKTNSSAYYTDVEDGIELLVGLSNSSISAGVDGSLAMGRNLGAIVMAADLVDLKTKNPVLDAQFRTKIVTLTTLATSGAAKNLIECHDFRPNNWGHHCGATRLAIAIYTNNATEIEKVVSVLKKGIGEPSSHTGFNYGGPSGDKDYSWQCDQSNYVFINRKGCQIQGHVVDGSQPEEMRRACSFQWPPCDTTYNWEGMQGLLAQMHMLERLGYPASSWGDQAIKRAAAWLYSPAMADPAVDDDQWQVSVLNYYYNMGLDGTVPARPGKNVGFTDWLLTGTPTTEPTVCKGDFNSDKQINIVDFQVFSQSYKKVLSSCTLDLVGGDCTLNIQDFSYFASVYKKPNACTT